VLPSKLMGSASRWPNIQHLFDCASLIITPLILEPAQSVSITSKLFRRHSRVDSPMIPGINLGNLCKSWLQ